MARPKRELEMDNVPIGRTNVARRRPIGELEVPIGEFVLSIGELGKSNG